MSQTWWSFTPRLTTIFTLMGWSPARSAAAIPSSTWSTEKPTSFIAVKTLLSRESRLTVTRSSPAARSAAALRGSSEPFVVSVRSRTPSMSRSMATSRSISFRSSGSPPVSRIFSTPWATNRPVRRTISSKLSSSARGRKAKSRPNTSFGMQYVHRKLQRSVTEIRISRNGRPRRSVRLMSHDTAPSRSARSGQKVKHDGGHGVEHHQLEALQPVAFAVLRDKEEDADDERQDRDLDRIEDQRHRMPEKGEEHQDGRHEQRDLDCRPRGNAEAQIHLVLAGQDDGREMLGDVPHDRYDHQTDEELADTGGRGYRPHRAHQYLTLQRHHDTGKNQPEDAPLPAPFGALFVLHQRHDRLLLAGKDVACLRLPPPPPTQAGDVIEHVRAVAGDEKAGDNRTQRLDVVAGRRHGEERG